MKKRKVTLFDIINGAFLIAFCLTIIIPFLHLLAISLSPSEIATMGGLHLLPKKMTFSNYKIVVRNPYIWSGYRATLLRTIAGTVLSLFVTSMGAYAMSKPYFPQRGFWTFIVVFTMFFSGGAIPGYLLIKDLGLMDSLWALILPGLVSAYNLVLMRNFISALPEELEESCMLDGAGRFTIFFRIVLPCSKPILATIGLWVAVGHWNAWYDALLYIRDPKKLVLQNVLRRIVLEGSTQMMKSAATLTQMDEGLSTEGVKSAVIFVATIPIICVYPFLQKYFVKGTMVGSLKG